MRRDGGDRQSSLSHVPELDVSLVCSCQHSAPGSTPSHVGSSHLKGTVSRDGFGFWWQVRLVLGLNRGRDHYFNCWGAPMILLRREGILGRNWDKILKTFWSLLFTVTFTSGFYSPLWINWSWDFYSNSWKWGRGLALFTTSLCLSLIILCLYINTFFPIKPTISNASKPYQPYGFRNIYKTINQRGKLKVVHE